MNIIRIILFCFIPINFTNAQENKFSLTGKTSGIEDGKFLYIRDLVNGGNIDSAQVKNNRFTFNTELPEPILYVMLFTKDRSKFKQLWLERSKMFFDASGRKFPKAKVKGSKTQELAEKMSKKVYSNVRSISKDSLKQREEVFISNNLSSILVPYILDGNQKWSQDEVGDVFIKLTRNVQRSTFGKRISKYLDKDVPDIGEEFKDLSAPNQYGEIKNLSELMEDLTLLQFWSSSCRFSRDMNETLKRLYSKHQDKGFEIISISNDLDKSEWIKAIKEDKMKWPQLSNLEDWDGKIFSAYNINSTPSNLLVNKEGKIIAKNIRNENLEKTIEKHLKSK